MLKPTYENWQFLLYILHAAKLEVKVQSPYLGRAALTDYIVDDSKERCVSLNVLFTQAYCVLTPAHVWNRAKYIWTTCLVRIETV